MPIAIVNIALPDTQDNASLVSRLGGSSVDKSQFANNLVNMVQGMAAGSIVGSISYQTNPVSVVTQRSVTLTFDNAGFVDGDSFAIGILEFACTVAPPAQENHFQVGASSALTAQSFYDLATGVFYTSVAGGFMSFEINGAVVTVTQRQLGMSLIALTSNNDAFALFSSNSFYPGSPPFDTSVPQVCAILNYGLATEAP